MSSRVKTKLKDKEYREEYADSFLESLIATQIKALREQRDLTQEQLAELADMKQSRISTMEDVNYGSWSINTLKRLAKAFDLVPIFSFEEFNTIFGRYLITRDNLERASFADDHRLNETALEAVDYTAILRRTVGINDRIPATATTSTNQPIEYCVASLDQKEKELLQAEAI